MKKRKIRKKAVTDAAAEMKTVKNMLLHLEDEYRKANISDRSYSELKEKYTKKLERLVDGGSDAEPDIETDGGEEKKEGFLGNIMGKKEKPKEKKEKKVKKLKEGERIEPGDIEEVTPEMIEKLAQQMADDQDVSADDVGGRDEEEEESDGAAGGGTLSAEVENKLRIELEKLKVMIEGIRDSKHITDETIQTISETIGEMRSMIFQTDASVKENMIKMEKLEDDVAGTRPQEITKKLRQTDGDLEKVHLEMEKLERKTSGQSERLNKVVDMLKGLGGIENLINLNKKIKEKLEDVKEAENYIERIGNKIEKIYIDLSRGIEDVILIRAKQEDFDSSVKDVIKSIDNLSVKFNNYVNKKDVDDIREDLILIKKKIEELDKVVPIADLKLPENLVNLRKDREDIRLFLETAEEQYKTKEITREEYESIKSGNMKKLKEINDMIKREWGKFEETMKGSKEEAEPEQTPETLPQEESQEESVEESPEEEETVEKEVTEEAEEKPKKKAEKKVEKTPDELEAEKLEKNIKRLRNEISKAYLSNAEKDALMKQIVAGNISTVSGVKKEIEFIKEMRKKKSKPLVKKKSTAKEISPKKTKKVKKSSAKKTKKAKKPKKKESDSQKKMKILKSLRR